MKVKNTIGYEELNPNNIKIRCSIIIPVFNNYNFTKACLKDLSKLSYEYEVIIVDNASDDNTTYLDRLPKADLPKRFTIIKSGVNEGYARGNARGYLVAQGESILFLNNDIRVQKNYATWIEDLLKAAEDGSLVGPTAGLLDGSLNFVKEMDKIEPGNCYMSGWCLCAKKEVFDKLILEGCGGPFSYEFGIAFFEDTDMAFRAKELNIPFKIVPVPVVHFEHMTAKKIGLNNLYMHAKTIFVKKWQNRI
jgi:GT2 family glycosyltransferase